MDHRPPFSRAAILNPLDEEGYQQIEVGDEVRVTGHVDYDFFEGARPGRELRPVHPRPTLPMRMVVGRPRTTAPSAEPGMRVYDRAVQGAEAGVVAAATVEVSFFVLDLVRLDPLATPGVLSGASIGPGGLAMDLTDLSGVIAGLWGAYQILTLTFVHFLAFAVVGVIASLLFDWSRPGGPGRIVFVALLCTLAFFVVVALSSSMVALDSVGTGLVIAMNLLGALALAGALRWVSLPAKEGNAE